MNYFFTISIIGLLLLTSDCQLQAQAKDSTHAWKIVITQTVRDQGSSESLPGSIGKTYTYYRHNNLVLRKEPVDTNRSHSDAAAKQEQGHSVTTSMTAGILSPVYLIDLNKKLTYTFCKDSNFYVAVDSLARSQEDMIFKIMAANFPANSGLKYSKDSEKEVRNLAGFSSIPMIAVYPPKPGAARSSVDTVQYSRSAVKLPVESPLDSFVLGAEHDLLEVCLPLDEIPGARLCFTITKLEEVIVPMKMFSIPDEYEKRSEVPLSKVLMDIVME